MGWTWREGNLDLILVPFGLLILLSYHIFLLYRVLKFPQSTVIGWENHNIRAWIHQTLQLEPNNRGMAISVLSADIAVATDLSSISLALSSLIGAWVASSSNKNIFTAAVFYGDTSQSIVSIKYIALLICFLVAFACFVQTTRHYVHATFLITMPNADIPVSYVEKAVIRGGNFWAVGMRALYFAATLIFWIFGPIPIFVSSILLVGILHKIDSNSSPLIQYRKPMHEQRDVSVETDQELTAAAGDFSQIFEE